MARYIFGTSNFHIYNQNRPWKLQYFYIVLEIDIALQKFAYIQANIFYKLQVKSLILSRPTPTLNNDNFSK